MSLDLQTSNEPNLAPLTPLLQNMQERQTQDRSESIDPEWFQEKKEELEQEEKPSWDAEVLKWAMLFLFIQGNHLLQKAKYGKGWRVAPPPQSTDVPVYGFNFTGFYSEGIRSQWTASNTDIRWRPTRDSEDAQGATRAAQHVRDDLRRKLYTNDLKQTEALLAQCGKYARYYYYTKKKKSYARRPKIETEQLQLGESTYFCADCGGGGVLLDAQQGMGDSPDLGTGMEPGGGVGDSAPVQPNREDISGAPVSGQQYPGGYQATNAGAAELNGQPEAPFGEMADSAMGSGLPDSFAGSGEGYDQTGMAQACPECGSPNISVTLAEPFEVERVAGYEEVEAGSIVCEPVPVFELKHDTTKSPQDSDYLIRSRRVRVDALQYEFPDLHVSKANGDDMGLMMEDVLKRSGSTGTRGGSKGSNETKTTDFIQIWLAPCLYANKKLKDDLVTRSGETIPAGTVLGERFPKGLYMAFIQGIKGVVELRNECHADFWVGGVLRQRACSSLGSGIESIVQANQQLNVIYALIYEQLRSSAMPATLFDQRLLPNGSSTYIGSLKNIPVELSAVEQKRLQDAVLQLQGQPPSAQHFGYAEKMNEFMQMDSRIMTFSGAFPGVNNKTATGAELGNAAQQSLFGPQLANKAEVDRRGAEIELGLFKTYCIDEQYISLSGKRGEQDGIWLSAAHINVDLFAEVVEDSYLPQTNLEKRERWDAFLQRVGGLPGLKMAMQESPAQVEQLAEIFDVDLAGEDFSAAAETCRQRVDQMIAALPMLQTMQAGMPSMQMAEDPMTGEMMPVPVDPMAEAGAFLVSILTPEPPPMEELGHMASIMWLRSWLTEDDGKKAPMELRSGVKALIKLHFEGLMAEGQLTGMVEMAAMPPAPMPAGQESEKKNERLNKNPDPRQMKGGQGQPKKQPEMAGAAA